MNLRYLASIFSLLFRKGKKVLCLFKLFKKITNGAGFQMADFYIFSFVLNYNKLFLKVSKLPKYLILVLFYFIFMLSKKLFVGGKEFQVKH